MEGLYHGVVHCGCVKKSKTIGAIVSELRDRTDRQTDRQTDRHTYITLALLSGSEGNHKHVPV